jgi:hypothetical protein
MAIINDKKYSIKTLGLLTGQVDVDSEKVPENILIIAQVVDDPDSLPYLLETLKYLKIEDMEKFRFVLLRVQIDSQLHLNEDMEKYHKRLFVSQVIEKLIYGELLLEGPKEDDEDDDED